MKVKHIYTLVAFASIMYFGFTTVQNDPIESRNKSIIKFSHSVHDGMAECVDCHSAVEESLDMNGSLLPVKDNCADCHDVDDEENCETCHYEDVNEALIPSTSDILFNHKYHISEQNMDCEKCHGKMFEVNYSFENTSAKPGMDVCFTCHNNTTIASNACEQCHISTDNLIPENHQVVGFFKNHKFADEDQCQMCHETETFCADCHVATTGIEETNLSNDFYAPYSPHNYVDGVKQQTITRVHDLNFRFTHGIDAKGKTDNCQTCHQTETFCAECHASEDGDFAMGGIMPLSHTKPNFVMGRTPGLGGDHAILAKRDIERCASCHDTQGADPNCMMCHTDITPGVGNDPKTHSVNFMNDNEGIFHSDGGATCYDCHINTNIAGVGFCSYCHGTK